MDDLGWRLGLAAARRILEENVDVEKDDEALEAVFAATRGAEAAREAGAALAVTCRQSMRCIGAAIGAIGDVIRRS